MKSKRVTIQTKATKQYFHLVLFTILCSARWLKLVILGVTIQFKDDRALRALSTSLWRYLASPSKNKQKISGSTFLLIHFLLRS